MEKKNLWDNTTAQRSKAGSTYGLTNNTTSILAMKIHQLQPTPDSPSRQSVIYLTFSTLDGEFVLLEDEYAVGKFNMNHLNFQQKLKMKTHHPIVGCWLEHQFHSTKYKDYLLAYLVDIFCNIYSVNFTTYIELNERSSRKQPIKYNIISINAPQINRQFNTIHYEYPLLFNKHNSLITTFNIAGQIKLYDITQEKSWINSYIAPDVYNFGKLGIAASCSSTKTTIGTVIIVALKNNQVPYAFVDCKTRQDYQQARNAIDNYTKQWQQPIHQITFCQYDSSTNLVCASLISQQIQIYELKKNMEEPNTFYHCQRILRFFPSGCHFQHTNHIEYLHANKGYLAMTTSVSYIILSLKEKTIIKRGIGNKDRSKVEKLKWTLVVDKQAETVAIVIAKGYNHHYQEQSKIGKPNLHFKTIDPVKKQK